MDKNLEIDGMRMCIVRYCIKTSCDNDDCKKCKIANLCSRNIREPRYNHCLDWCEERVRDAYKIIK